MLLRVDMPGLCFEDLNLSFDLPTGCLSYQPEPLEGLLSWNHKTLQDEFDPDVSDIPQGLHDLLMVCYAHWRLHGGRRVAAMEASVVTAAPVHLMELEPRSVCRRLYRALQAWLGLLEVHES